MQDIIVSTCWISAGPTSKCWTNIEAVLHELYGFARQVCLSSNCAMPGDSVDNIVIMIIGPIFERCTCSFSVSNQSILKRLSRNFVTIII